MLDADIAKCFDQIDHEALLKKLNTFPTLRRQIKAWLKAGVIDWSEYSNRDKNRFVDWVYWSNRRGNYPGTPKAVAALIKSQNGKCSHCGQYFTSDSLAEIHHKDMNRKNNKKENLTLVHRHCHDVIHGEGNKVLVEGYLDEHPF